MLVPATQDIATNGHQPEEKTEQTQWSFPNSNVQKDQLIARMDVYEHSIIVKSFKGKFTYTKMASPDEIAYLLGKQATTFSGILPENALWWQQSTNGQTLALWMEPQLHDIYLRLLPLQPAEHLKLPMPGMIFICNPSRPPYVFAAKSRPQESGDLLYRSPTFNTYRSGFTCQGTHKYPDKIVEIPPSFFESYFSITGDSTNRSKMFPDNLANLWHHLDGKNEYPMEDLVYSMTVEEAMQQVSEGRRL